MAQDPTPPLTPQRLEALSSIPTDDAPSPGYIVHLGRLEENCQLLESVAERSGAKILLALKGFACHSTFPLVRKYLSGTTSSGLHEGLLAHELFGKEVHVYSAAYKASELEHLSRFAHSLVFNSAGQLAAGVAQLDPNKRPELGLRVNPEYSEVETELYDPCSPASRLGTTREALDRALEKLPKGLLEQLDGLHFHALCEQDADALEHTADAFEEKFGDLIPGLKWLNFGGGHHITRPGYDIDRLCRTVQRFRERYNLEVYLEPGEAVALHTGVLVVTVLDLIEAGGHQIAILDSSATCHMPDVLEMPYRPGILDAGLPQEFEHTYRLGGMSCLAGDVIGDYSFAEPLTIGQRLVFLDMSHYTMVKNSTFNGVPLPAISLYHPDTGLETVRKFGYEDYRNRLS
ncbi:MAG: carboxynorspermidine decarboxylase [Opitutales bacterium]|jgi:carboxynorspermidine decarboxylase|nr:carboxynorspermidine decarboxylase [Opitutales bacterium]MDP4777357.1 carboxynorspermidine decarboxylase [Opitutales bacterium]MDP4883898.1 carboxynorspermidine decarboxylase [Opitutales bacterium]MDP5079488.1 carboxynorspermidine decarboxylase [Opitutales bacterium]